MRFIAIAAAAASLSACAAIDPIVTSQPDQLGIASLAGGEGSAIIFNVGGDTGCDYAYFGVMRSGAENNEVVTTVMDPGYETSHPVIMPVKPGRYSLNRGSCSRSGYYPADFPNLNRWFSSVEVGENEIVYLGTLDTQMVDFNTRSAYDDAWTRFWLEPVGANDFTYVTYRLVDNPEVRERVNALNPGLGERMVFRAPRQRISNETFVELLKKSYAPDAAGVLPTAVEASARFEAEVDRLMAEEAPPVTINVAPTKEPEAKGE